MARFTRACGPVVLPAVVAILAACSSDPRIASVRAFNDARDRGDLAAARAMLTPDAIVWYENPTGPGSPWRPGEGPWAAWDAHFQSSKRLVGDYQRDGDAVFALFEETNAYYRLTERTWSRTLLTWYVNDDGRIRGLIVAGVGESVSRADEFRAWAKEHEAVEYAYLFPSDQLDPTGDRPVRMRALLHKWRAAVGLPANAE